MQKKYKKVIGAYFGLCLGAMSWAASQVVAAEVPPPKVVIIWASYGNGHKSAGEGIKAEILKANPEALVEFKDVRDFMGPLHRWYFEKGFKLTGDHPEYYDRWYQKLMRDGAEAQSVGKMPRVGDYQAQTMADWVLESKPSVILSTFHHATEVLVKLREEGMIPKNIPIGWQHTDYTDHKYFARIAQAIDMSFLPHPELEKSMIEKHGVNPSQVMTTGISVSQKFTQAWTPEEKSLFLKKKGLEPQRRTITLMSGNAGTGDFPEIVRSLSENIVEPIQIVAICARNEKNYKNLLALQAKLPPSVKLKVEGFIPSDEVANYIRSSEIFIGKAGGLSSTETFVAQIPSIFLDNNGGQERFNIKFFEKEGLAQGVRSESEVGALANVLLTDQELREKVVKNEGLFKNIIQPEKIAAWTLESASHYAQEQVKYGSVGGFDPCEILYTEF